MIHRFGAAIVGLILILTAARIRVDARDAAAMQHAGCPREREIVGKVIPENCESQREPGVNGTR